MSCRSCGALNPAQTISPGSSTSRSSALPKVPPGQYIPPPRLRRSCRCCVLPRPCPESCSPTPLSTALPSPTLSVAYATARHRRPNRAYHAEHGPEEKRRQGASDCLCQDVARHSVPREVPPNREGQGNRRV